MKRSATLGAAMAILLTVSVAGPAGAIDDSMFHALTTSNRLLTFSGADSCQIAHTAKITGLAPGESLIGIDVRPVDGQLYGVGQLGTRATLYTLEPETGQATFVAVLRVAATGAPVVLAGTRFGVDFNPAADALRIVSDLGQNLRALPSDRAVMGTPRFTGDTFIDGMLSYMPSGASVRLPALGVAAAAYTNPDTDPTTGTTLYDIDTLADDLVIQNPPNDGTLVAVGSTDQKTGGLIGFDIAAGNVAWAAIKVRSECGNASLATVDLATGQLTIVGGIGTHAPIEGLAVAAPS